MTGRLSVGVVGWLVASLASLASPAASAHPLAPSALRLEEAASGEVALTWRRPVSLPSGERPTPRLEPACDAGAAAEAPVPGLPAVALTQQLHCGGHGLAGRAVVVEGLAPGGSNVLVHVRRADGRVSQALLDASSPRFAIPEAQGAGAVIGAYLWLGVEHLVFGWDHLLFVLGLLLLLRGRALVVGVTAFTLGHSVTLALAATGLVTLPQVVVEIAIAASLVAVAVEASRSPAHDAGPIARHPWLLPAAFGLLHGLGFAGALSEAGLPDEAIAGALLGFNVGLELGQLAVIAVALGVVAAARWLRVSSAFVRPVVTHVVGGMGAFFVIDRIAALLYS